MQVVAIDPTPAYVAVGRVTARIAACEQVMRLALGEREVERAMRKGDAKAERFQPFTTRMLTWDFGQLAHRVRTQFQLPDDPWIQVFKDAKAMRNLVAHDFWSPYYALLQSEEGLGIIVRHCNVIVRHFEHLTKGIVHATNVNVGLYADFISTSEWTHETKREFNAILAKAEEAIEALPSWFD